MERTFNYHRSVAPILWVLVTLAVIEMMVVHLFLTLRCPKVGWLIFALSFGSVIWMVYWIRSFRHCPHVLSATEIRLRTGSLREISVPLSSVTAVATSWAPGEHTGRGSINTVPLAYPNRMLRLMPPILTRSRTDFHRSFQTFR